MNISILSVYGFRTQFAAENTYAGTSMLTGQCRYSVTFLLTLLASLRAVFLMWPNKKRPYPLWTGAHGESSRILAAILKLHLAPDSCTVGLLKMLIRLRRAALLRRLRLTLGRDLRFLRSFLDNRTKNLAGSTDFHFCFPVFLVCSFTNRSVD